MSTDVEAASTHRSSNQAQCFVLIPTLTSTQKTKYRSVVDQEIDPDLEYEDVESVVGEAREGKMSYFYVRYGDGFIYKVSVIQDL